MSKSKGNSKGQAIGGDKGKGHAYSGGAGLTSKSKQVKASGKMS